MAVVWINLLIFECFIHEQQLWSSSGKCVDWFSQSQTHDNPISNKEDWAVFPILRLQSLKYKVTQGALSWCIYFLALSTKLSLAPEPPVGLLWCLLILCTFLYCCSSVLCSLKHPGPGKKEQKTSRDKVHLVRFLVIYVPMQIFPFSSRSYNTLFVVFTGLGIVCGPSLTRSAQGWEAMLSQMGMTRNTLRSRVTS